MLLIGIGSILALVGLITLLEKWWDGDYPRTIYDGDKIVTPDKRSEGARRGSGARGKTDGNTEPAEDGDEIADLDESDFEAYEEMLREERAVKMQPISSSTVKAIGYSRQTDVLYVDFAGGAKYMYFNVPEEVYEEFLRAPSKGSFVSNRLTPFFDYNVLDMSKF